MSYAKGTVVSVEKTVAELVGLVRRFGGSQIAQLDDSDRFVIGFSMAERQVRFIVGFDPPTHQRFSERRTGKYGRRAATNEERIASSEQHRRERMRALLLVVKAKLESVESRVETFEEAFLANFVMPDARTLYEHVREPIKDAYLLGPQSTARLLPDFSK
jgi:hypothetical protein